jgi:hypothetical protein
MAQHFRERGPSRCLLRLGETSPPISQLSSNHHANTSIPDRPQPSPATPSKAPENTAPTKSSNTTTARNSSPIPPKQSSTSAHPQQPNSSPTSSCVPSKRSKSACKRLSRLTPTTCVKAGARSSHRKASAGYTRACTRSGRARSRTRWSSSRRLRVLLRRFTSSLESPRRLTTRCSRLVFRSSEVISLVLAAR